jgi:hypothetical protein
MALKRDDFKLEHDINPVIASEAKQSRSNKEDWIASSQELLAMTELAIPIQLKVIPL